MNINVDFTKNVGKIKPMHAINGGAIQGYVRDIDYSKIVREANIPYARYHDIEGSLGMGQYVDIHCVFPNFDADENDPKSYNFMLTDDYVKDTIDAGMKPFYRLGETIDHSKYSLYINPPRDFAKWARICEHIIRHYNEGWADGFEFGIEYWEIWNEPEGVPASNMFPMWTGTPEQYYELYKITANHLKKCFGDSIKIGGYAAISLSGLAERTKDEIEYWPTGRSSTVYYAEFFTNFLKYITSKENFAPIDFFSYHKYNNCVNSIRDFADVTYAIREKLDEFGLNNTEMICNEWNHLTIDKDWGGIESAVGVAAMMCESQRLPVDMLMYYMLNHGPGYNGIARKDGTVLKSFYPIKEFGKLYKMGNDVEFKGGDEYIKVASAAGEKNGGMLIANMGCTQNCTINYKMKAPVKSCGVYVTDDKRDEKLILKLNYRRSESDIFLTIPEKSIMYIEFELF